MRTGDRSSRRMVALSRDGWSTLSCMEPAGLMLIVVVLALPTLTALGARRRGCTLPGAVLAGLCFPLTWVVWYVHDSRPVRHARHK